MKPSTTIKVAAVAMVLAGLLLIYVAIFVPFFFFLQRQTILSNPRPWLTRFLIHGVAELALITWLFATAVGLFRLRPWARVSILTLSVCGVYQYLGGVIGMIAIGLTTGWRGPWSLDWRMTGGLMLFFLGMGGVAALWVRAFSDSNMDGIFGPQTAAPLDSPASAELALQTDATVPVAVPRIPLSLSVIAAWLMLLWPLTLYEISCRILTLLAPVPAAPLGLILGGGQRTVYFVALALAGAAVGWGLLKGRNWGWVGAAVLSIFSIVTVIAAATRPYAFGASAGWWHGSMDVWLSPMLFWLQNLWDTLPAAAALYFLITRRFSFHQLRLS